MISPLSLSGKAIDGQLGLYQEQAEAWKLDHDRAMDCLDIEAITNFGLGIHRSILHADQTWTQAVRSGAMAMRREDAERISRWYTWWIKPCDMLLDKIGHLELDGYHVDNAAEFKDACLHVRSVLSIPLDAALSEDGGGRGRTTGEIRDGLARRLEQAGR